MAILDPVKLGAFIDDPSADDANIAFARINANEKLLNEEVRPIVTGGTGNTTGLAASATKLATARTLSWTGDVTGSTAFDGTANKATAMTLAASGVTAGTFKSVTVNAKGLITAGNDVVTGLVTATTAAGTANAATTNSNTFLNITEKVGAATTSASASTQITGAGTVTVASDTAGKITVTGAAPPLFSTGIDGLVPARIGAVATKYLREDGTWVTPTNTTYTNMSAAEIAAGTATTGRLITPKDLKTAVGTYPSSNITGVAAIANGGTGATTAAEAIVNLGVIGIAEYGVGGTVNSLGNIGQATTQAQNPDIKTGMYDAVDIIGAFMAIKSAYGTLLLGGSAYTGGTPQYAYYNSANGNKILNAAAVHTFYTTQNAVKDGNGFLKGASPVADLYADKIELNREAQEQDITFEKIGTGDYLIKCSTGLASDGWYIEQPKDSNGNVYHAVDYGTHQNGDIWIKTYVKKLNEIGEVIADLSNPIDIKEGRFISIRLNELPKDTTAPINPSIKDSEGNVAPTKYHTLEGGVWTISDEDVAKLEQERLAAMQPLKRRQFRLALVMNDFDLAAVEALIEGIEDSMQRTIALIEWQDATDFERTNPTLLKMAELMQLTTEQVDQLWDYGLSL